MTQPTAGLGQTKPPARAGQVIRVPAPLKATSSDMVISSGAPKGGLSIGVSSWTNLSKVVCALKVSYRTAGQTRT